MLRCFQAWCSVRGPLWQMPSQEPGKAENPPSAFSGAPQPASGVGRGVFDTLGQQPPRAQTAGPCAVGAPGPQPPQAQGSPTDASGSSPGAAVGLGIQDTTGQQPSRLLPLSSRTHLNGHLPDLSREGLRHIVTNILNGVGSLDFPLACACTTTHRWMCARFDIEQDSEEV